MSIFVFGINHQTAPLAVREQVAFAAEQLPAILHAVAATPGVEEAVVLSTCNRTEFYTAGLPHSERPLVDWLVQHKTLERGVIDRHFYHYGEQQAVRHALRVACGLDSLVVGEPQILGQIKDAYHTAVASGTTGKQLNKLMQYTFAVAKKVRTGTAIGATPVSVAYAAVRLARQVHGELNTRRALLIGAGDTIELVAQHLRGQHIAELVFANRTLERAQKLAVTLGGRAIPLTQMPAALAAADIVITATAARLPVVTRAMLEGAIKARRFNPMFVVDLAVPRDVEASASELADIYLYTVDDLDQVIAENLDLRQVAARQAETIVDVHAREFMDWVQSLDGNETIVAYRRQIDGIAQDLLGKAERRLASGEDPRQVLAGLARALTNKLIHHPTAKIREAASEGRLEFIDHARELLAITREDPPA